MSAEETKRGPRAVAADERVVRAAAQTAGLRREEAFSGDDRWVGYVSTEPGEWSGWHHHGEQDTYLYMLRGNTEFELGDGQRLPIPKGSFGHMPAGVVHRERTLPGEPGEAILVRIGPGPSVVNVDRPG